MPFISRQNIGLVINEIQKIFGSHYERQENVAPYWQLSKPPTKNEEHFVPIEKKNERAGSF